MSKSNSSSSELENADRREVMSAIMKYSVVVGGATTTVLSASEAIAKSAASGARPAGVTREEWDLGRHEMERWDDRKWEKWREWERWKARKVESWRRD